MYALVPPICENVVADERKNKRKRVVRWFIFNANKREKSIPSMKLLKNGLQIFRNPMHDIPCSRYWVKDAPPILLTPYKEPV
jgi:hypothetical protein